MIEPFYGKNPILQDTTVNVCFEELLDMNNQEFDDWVCRTRKAICHAWDTCGTPPRSGKSLSEIVDSFNEMSSIDVSKFARPDELVDPKDNSVVHNTIHAGTEVDQFFSNMMKVAMCYGTDTTGYSVYDLFSQDKYKNSMVKRSHRHFRRDSFYHYSLCIKKNDRDGAVVACNDGLEWIDSFQKNPDLFVGKDFWISPNKIKNGVSTGYYQVQQSDFISLSKDDLLSVWNTLSARQRANVKFESIDDKHTYLIRLFDLGQRIFPKGFTAYRIGYISVPINFPPLTAKHLYERFTEHLIDRKDTITIYDPSSGWGGRLLGSLSVKDNRKIHYVGTDPNPDNVFTDGKTKYEHIHDFFINHTYRGRGHFSDPNTCEIFRDGSEEIGKNPKFQKYRGVVDLVFTSPPYFNRELYSKDANQSAVKYGSSYESWRDGFLKPTLQTCVEYLRPGGYLLWNIADVKTNIGYLPLEQDSIDTLLALGMEQHTTLKMTLASMPGAQRLDENGIPKCKNFCKVGGRYVKYEPIFVFRKPVK